MSLKDDPVDTVLLPSGGTVNEADFVVRSPTYKTNFRTVSCDLGVGETLSIFRLKSNGQPYAVAQFTLDDTTTTVNVLGIAKWRAVRNGHTNEVLISKL